jgi:hypothetical protein
MALYSLGSFPGWHSSLEAASSATKEGKAKDTKNTRTVLVWRGGGGGGSADDLCTVSIVKTHFWAGFQLKREQCSPSYNVRHAKFTETSLCTHNH